MTAPRQPASQPGPSVEDLAADYLRRVEDGETPDLAGIGAGLGTDAQRQALRRLVEAARHTQSLLPVQARPGTVLAGRYRLLGELGAGGMGKVFEAEDLRLKRRVAIKVLAVFGMPSFDPHALLRQEAEILASFQHPNIVAVHEIAREGELHYLVMDLVRGRPLTRVLADVRQALGDDALPRDGRLLQAEPAGRDDPPQRVGAGSWFDAVAALAETLARTLAHAHERGLVHRDIKPANVMLTTEGTPVVLDFGLAGTREVADSGITAGLVGSAAYLAPEQARNEQVGKDPRTDVYQLGVLLYELLTLRPAYEESSVPVLLEKVSRGHALPPRRLDPGIPAELEAICLMAMETDPEHRYATALALAEDVRRYLDGTELPIAARGAATLGRRVRFAWHRHRGRLTAAAGVALLALVALVSWWARGPRLTEIEPFLFRPLGDLRASLRDGTGQSAFGAAIRDVAPGDALGVIIDAVEPSWVYALSVFGSDPEEPEWLAPMEVEFLTAEGAEEDGPRASVGFAWGLPIPAGESRLVCTLIRERDGYEGLWVFTSPEPVPTLDSWMEVLSDLAAHSSRGAVPLGLASAAFGQLPSGPRGISPRLDEVERLALGREIDRAYILGEQPWPFPDSLRFEIVLPVQ